MMKQNRTLALSIPLMLVLLGLLFYQYVYLNIQTKVASIKESQAIKTKTLEKYISLISEKPQLEKELASLKEERKSEDLNLIEGQTLTLIGASLQDTVKDIVSLNGGTIASERISKTEDLGRFKVISVSLDTMMPDTRALRDVIYSLETRTPYLIIKDIDIRVRNYRDPREEVVKLDVAALAVSK